MKIRWICSMLMLSLAWSYSGVGWADDNARAIAFSHANGGKFRTEVAPVQGVGIGQTIVVTGSLDPIDVLALHLRYNVTASAASPGSLASFHSLMFQEKCSPTGSFVGQNGFGAKMTVQRQDCIRFFVSAHPSRWIKLGGKHIPMSPSQFRAIQTKGMQAQVDFLVGHENDVTVQFSDVVNAAKLDYPFESRMRVWSIRGEFTALRWKLPGSSEWTPVWQKE